MMESSPKTQPPNARLNNTTSASSTWIQSSIFHRRNMNQKSAAISTVAKPMVPLRSRSMPDPVSAMKEGSPV
ncbi:hypothetical protein [Verrucomicrobium spinosum]|uniref:hypothetical protein n=1 Tax=Verrucomicrobium spinosum TaxID=2736 RepID=UPI0009467E53